jgi:hypothetical protein
MTKTTCLFLPCEISMRETTLVEDRIAMKFEKSLTAPQGRNKIACGSATGVDKSLFIKPCQGGIKYSALTGLAMMIGIGVLWRVPQAIISSPPWGFSSSFLQQPQASSLYSEL